MASTTAVERTSPATSHDVAADVALGAARSAVNGRLLESLLHDVRNPLNALSINLDVLTEKLRREQGEIPATQEKNLKVMREQVFRVDGILKQFSEFMAPRPDSATVVDLSETLRQALLVLGHECRRNMIRLRQMVEPDVKIPGTTPGVRFLVLQAVFRGVGRAGSEGEVAVTLQREGETAVLRVKDGGSPDGPEPFPQAEVALRTLCEGCGAQLRMAGNELSILFSSNS